MLDIYAVGDYYANLTDDVSGDDLNQLPDVSNDVKALCTQRFRRIDRFTQLCLLGSARCAQQVKETQAISPSTGLYIGSRYASLGNTTEVHRSMITEGHIPKPAKFINTLSNSAGYQVGKNLGLSGKNLFVSRDDTSFEAALEIAAIDLLADQLNFAFVGCVDEAVAPFKEHRLRLQIDADEPIAEGSHWFFVGPKVEESKAIATIDVIRSGLDHVSVEHFFEQLEQNEEQECFFTGNCEIAEINALNRYSNLKVYPSEHSYYPAKTGGVVAHFIQNINTTSRLISVQKDRDGRYCLIIINRK